MRRLAELTVAIPTYRRGAELLVAVESLLRGTALPAEVLLVDQTEAHPPAVAAALDALVARGDVRLVRHAPPSSTGARNRALREARTPIVLFLDDDVTCDPSLAEEHARHYADPEVVGVAGRIHEPAFPRSLPFHFRLSLSGRALSNYDLDRPCRSTLGGGGGNLSVRRERALAVGGFDERFVRGAQNEDLDFIRRLVAAGGRVPYEPRARLVHHVAPRGGGRASADLSQLLGDYFQNDAYFALRHLPGWRLPLYLGRQVVSTARIALGSNRRVFPALEPGLGAWPLVARASLGGLTRAALTWARARAEEGFGPRRGTLRDAT